MRFIHVIRVISCRELYIFIILTAYNPKTTNLHHSNVFIVKNTDLFVTRIELVIYRNLTLHDKSKLSLNEDSLST